MHKNHGHTSSQVLTRMLRSAVVQNVTVCVAPLSARYEICLCRARALKRPLASQLQVARFNEVFCADVFHDKIDVSSFEFLVSASVTCFLVTC